MTGFNNRWDHEGEMAGRKQEREGRGGSTATHIYGGETRGTCRVNLTSNVREKRGKMHYKKTHQRHLSVGFFTIRFPLGHKA